MNLMNKDVKYINFYHKYNFLILERTSMSFKFASWSRISIGLCVEYTISAQYAISWHDGVFCFFVVFFFWLSKLSTRLIFQTALLKICVSYAVFSSMWLNMRHATPHTMRLSHQSASDPSIPTALPLETPSTRSPSPSQKTWGTCEFFTSSNLKPVDGSIWMNRNFAPN